MRRWSSFIATALSPLSSTLPEIAVALKYMLLTSPLVPVCAFNLSSQEFTSCAETLHVDQKTCGVSDRAMLPIFLALRCTSLTT